MKAMVQDRFGGPEVLELRDVPDPVVDDDRVLVRVRAAGLNPLDWHFMRGEPLLFRLGGAGLRRPARRIQGSDVAGVVEAVGPAVTRFRPGDEVFGWCRGGSLAELVAPRERFLLPKPERLSFEEAGGVAVAGFTALQAVRDQAGIGAGDRVLVVGASGGVGTFAVQIAVAFGASVTGVCSTRNVDLVRSLGAEEVIDYTLEDFADRTGAFDAVLHIAGNRSVADGLRALAAGGTLVNVGGGEDGGRLLGPLKRLLPGLLRGPFVSQDVRTFTAAETQEDGEVLRDLLVSGRIRTVVDRTYPLAEAAEAMRYLESLRARGKVVVVP